MMIKDRVYNISTLEGYLVPHLNSHKMTRIYICTWLHLHTVENILQEY